MSSQPHPHRAVINNEKLRTTQPLRIAAPGQAQQGQARTGHSLPPPPSRTMADPKNHPQRPQLNQMPQAPIVQKRDPSGIRPQRASQAQIPQGKPLRLIVVEKDSSKFVKAFKVARLATSQTAPQTARQHLRNPSLPSGLSNTTRGILIADGEMPSTSASTNHSSFNNGNLSNRPVASAQNNCRKRPRLEPLPSKCNIFSESSDRSRPTMEETNEKTKGFEMWIETTLPRSFEKGGKLVWLYDTNSQRKRLLRANEVEEVASTLNVPMNPTLVRELKNGASNGYSRTSMNDRCFTWLSCRKFPANERMTKLEPISAMDPPVVELEVDEQAPPTKKRIGCKKRKTNLWELENRERARCLALPAPMVDEPRPAPEYEAVAAVPAALLLARPINGQGHIVMQTSYTLPSRATPAPRRVLPSHNTAFPKSTLALPVPVQARNDGPIPVHNPPATHFQRTGNGARPNPSIPISGEELQRMQSSSTFPANGVYSLAPANATTQRPPTNPACPILRCPVRLLPKKKLAADATENADSEEARNFSMKPLMPNSSKSHPSVLSSASLNKLPDHTRLLDDRRAVVITLSDDEGVPMISRQLPPPVHTRVINNGSAITEDDLPVHSVFINDEPSDVNPFDQDEHVPMIADDISLPRENSTQPIPIPIEDEIAIASVVDAELKKNNRNRPDDITDGDEDDTQQSDADDEPSGGEYGYSDDEESEVNSLVSSLDLDHMSEQEQMDYPLNKSSVDHKKSGVDVTDEDANEYERRPSVPQPPASSLVIPEHSTPVIPSLQKPPFEAQPASSTNLHSIKQGQIDSRRSPSDENEETEGSSLGENSASSSPPLDLGEESVAAQSGDEEAEPTTSDETIVDPMEDQIDSTDDIIDVQSISNSQEEIKEDEDEKFEDGVEDEDNKEEPIEVPEDLTEEESASISTLASFDEDEMRENMDDELDDEVEEEDNIDNQTGDEEEDAESSVASTSGIDEPSTSAIADEDAENQMEQPTEDDDDSDNEQSTSNTDRKSLSFDKEETKNAGDQNLDESEDEEDMISNEAHLIGSVEADDNPDESTSTVNPGTLPSLVEDEMRDDGEFEEVDRGEEENENSRNEEAEERAVPAEEEVEEEEEVDEKTRQKKRAEEYRALWKREPKSRGRPKTKAGAQVTKIEKNVNIKPRGRRGRPRKTIDREEEWQMPSTSRDSVSDATESLQQIDEPSRGRSQKRTMEQLCQAEDPQLYLVLLKKERSKAKSTGKRRIAQLTDEQNSQSALEMLERRYKKKKQLDSRTKTYTMSTLHEIEQRLDISFLNVDSDGNLVGQVKAESDSTESDSEMVRDDDDLRPPRGFSIIAPRRENAVGKRFEELFETNTAPALPPPHPPLPPRTEYATTPIIEINSKEEADSEELRRCMENLPISMLRGVIEAKNIDLEIFSAESLHKNHPNLYVELRTQLKFDDDTCMTRRGKETWEYISVKEIETIEGYMAYYQESIQKAVNGVLGLGKRTMDGTNIKFGTNIDMTRDQVEFEDEFKELDKLPAFCRMSSDRDLLQHVEHKIYGVNTPQAYIKVPGNRTPAHLENNCLSSVNINVGPGTCVWYACDFKYWGYINEELEKRGMNFLRSSWWPDSDFLLSIGVPVYKFTQHPGDIVVVGPGSPHWVQADGWCSNIAWNVCPSTHVQLTMAIHQYEWNVHQKYESLLPIQYFFWILAMKNNITDPKVFALVKATLARSLANCYTMVEYVEKKLGRKLNPVPREDDQEEPIAHRGCFWKRKFENEDAYYSCEAECFNILFVKTTKEPGEEGENESNGKDNRSVASSETTKPLLIDARSRNVRRMKRKRG